MKEYLKVEGHPDLVRDPSTNAILNTNYEAVKLAQQRKELRKQEKERVRNIEERIAGLESDIKEIKEGINYLIKNL